MFGSRRRQRLEDAVIALLSWTLDELRRHHPRDATSFELSSITIHNNHLKGNIMAIAIDKSLPFVTGTLLPKADDAQGNKVPGKLKDGSLVTYVVADPSIATITPDPTDPLKFKLQWLAVGVTTWQATGVNPGGGAVVLTEDLTTTDTNEPPPVPDATSFAVQYDAPTAS